MTVWHDARTLLLTAIPLLLPHVITLYNRRRTKAATSPVPVRPGVRPIPSYVSHAMNVLFVAAVIAALSTLPQLSPDNIWTLTSSNIRTPTDVLFNRLSALRPGKELTSLDSALRDRLTSIDGRCIYFTYGPWATANCPFCNSDGPSSFWVYSLPEILVPHVLNLFVLGIATSPTVSGKEGGRWRTMTTLLGSVLAIADAYYLQAYDWKANAKATSPEKIQYLYWQMRTFRGLAIALLDSGFAGFLWATATNRLLAIPVSSAERLETVTRTMEATRGKLAALGIIRNVTVRDESLRKNGERYWRTEGEMMGQVMDEKEVVDGVRNALSSGRISVTMVEEDARRYAEGIIGTPIIRQPTTENQE